MDLLKLERLKDEVGLVMSRIASANPRYNNTYIELKGDDGTLYSIHVSRKEAQSIGEIYGGVS